MTLKEEIEEILHPEKKDLYPPIAPKLIVSEKSGEQGISPPLPISKRLGSLDSKPTIDFSYLTNNSSFQRAIMEFIKKFVPGFENVEARGSKEIMVKSFDINAQNYRECMQELKEKLEKLK